MSQTEKIIKAIDDELIESGKDYLLLGQANGLLITQNIISVADKSKQILKKILENNEIPHAYQTETPPRQWRIPLSKEAELKYSKKKNLPKKTTQKPNLNIQQPNITNSFNNFLNSKYSNCPRCNLNMVVAIDLKNEYFQCLSCGHNFRNQLQNSLGLTKIQRNWLIAISVFVLLWIIGSLSDNDSNNNTNSDSSNTNSTSNNKAIVYNSEWDASVYQVEQYLKNEYLKDPDSYESMGWSKVNEENGSDYKYWVRHKYRAKNSYGGYGIENKLFYLDANGVVVRMIDY